MISIKEKQAILQSLFVIALDYEDNPSDYMQGVYSGAKQIFVSLFGFDPVLMVRDVVNDWKHVQTHKHITQGQYTLERAEQYAKTLKPSKH